jgi:hypothetical protein
VIAPMLLVRRREGSSKQRANQAMQPSGDRGIRSKADHLSIEDALQLLRKAFEINQLAFEPVHRQFTAQLLDAFADGEPLFLFLLRRSLQSLACIYGNWAAKFQRRSSVRVEKGAVRSGSAQQSCDSLINI